MRKLRSNKILKKLFSLLLVFTMIVVMSPAGIAFAANDDVRDALDELAELSSSAKAALLGQVWDYVVTAANTESQVTEDEIYAQLAINLSIWDNIVSSDIPTPDGKISEASVRLVIQKTLENRDTFIGLYDTFYGNSVTKEIVKSALNADTDLEAYTELLKYTEPFFTRNSDGEFIRNTAITTPRIATLFGSEYTSSLSMLVKAKIDEVAEKINENIGSEISSSDVIYAMNIYGLYKAPASTGGGSGGSSGGSVGSGGGAGGSTIPTTTPAPTPTPAPTSAPVTLPDAGKIQDAATPEEALDLAKDAIQDAAKILDSAVQEGVSTAEVNQALTEIAAAVMAKINVETVNAVVESGKARITVSQEEAQKLMDKLDTIVSTAKELNTQLISAKADVKVEAVLEIKAQVAAGVKEAEAALPADLLKAAAEKGIDKVAIDTGIARIAITPDAIDTAEGETVSLSVNKVDANELSEEVKAAVGDSQVFDFNAAAGDRKVTAFNKPVEITVPYTLKSGEDAKKITVFFINDEGKLENIIGVYDEKTKTVKFTTAHFSKYVVKVNNVTFNDIAAEWAKENIEVMAAKGIIDGVGNGDFAPAANVTRAEFAAMVVRAFKLGDAAAAESFGDVNDTDWFQDEVASAAKAGIIDGIGDGLFAPNQNISRQDMACIIARALANVKGKGAATSDDSYLAKFEDKGSISSYAKTSVAAGVKYSIIDGMTDKTFVPTNLATRAQAAAMIYRLFFIQ